MRVWLAPGDTAIVTLDKSCSARPCDYEPERIPLRSFPSRELAAGWAALMAFHNAGCTYQVLDTLAPDAPIAIWWPANTCG